MGDELDRLGITEDEVTRRYERVVLRRAAEILRTRMPRRSFVAQLLHSLGVQEFEIEVVIRRLEREAERGRGEASEQHPYPAPETGAPGVAPEAREHRGPGA